MHDACDWASSDVARQALSKVGNHAHKVHTRIQTANAVIMISICNLMRWMIGTAINKLTDQSAMTCSKVLPNLLVWCISG